MHVQNLITLTRPREDTFKAQLQSLVEDYAALRADRAAEILTQLGHPTPFFASIALLDPERTRWTLELLYAAIEFAYYVVMRFKHGLACRRPHEYSPQVQPMIPTPLHGTFPSGHATESFTAAVVLWELIREATKKDRINRLTRGLTERAEICSRVQKLAQEGKLEMDALWHKQLMAQAARIAVNRMIAGVHFTVDTAAGTVLGISLGNYLVARFKNDPEYLPWTFNGEAYAADDNARHFLLAEFVDPETGKQLIYKSAAGSTIASFAEKATLEPAGQSKILKWIWDEAVKEWQNPPPPG
jgi:membrane-associated phospholipid phosphatase